MKAVLLFWVMSVSFLVTKGQESKLPLDQNGQVKYTNVITTSDTAASKSQLFVSAKLWFANYFKSAKNVIQIDDQENGRLLGKGANLIKTSGIEFYLNYTIEILIKKGKFKYVIYDLYFPSSNVALSDMNKIRNDDKFKEESADINSSFNQTITSLISAMNTPVQTDF